MLIAEAYEKKKKEAKDAALAGDVVVQWRYSHYLMHPNSTYEEYRQGLVFLILAASHGHCFAQIEHAYTEFTAKEEKRTLMMLCNIISMSEIPRLR
jgi:hypothetical protein